jgi:tellurite resistance protein TerC
MPAPAPITISQWVGFVVIILIFLALDLGIFHRSSRIIKPREALLWCLAWFLLAMIFACELAVWRGPDESLEFVTGYFVEFSLSMDNVVAIALIFTSFGVAARHQHRVLFWGILGALVMRGTMIGAGAALIQKFNWILYLMGAFLVFTGIKWGFSKPAAAHPKNNPILRLARKIFPVSDDFDGGKFLTRKAGRNIWTPLALVLLLVETTDLIFAVDSIPAIFAVTQKAFIVFTSNVFAILGLRSLYFAVAGAIQYFRYLKAGLAAVLVFVGVKMLGSPWYAVPPGLSLAVVAAIMAFSIWLSRRAVRRGKRT